MQTKHFARALGFKSFSVSVVQLVTSDAVNNMREKKYSEFVTHVKRRLDATPRAITGVLFLR